MPDPPDRETAAGAMANSSDIADLEQLAAPPAARPGPSAPAAAAVEADRYDPTRARERMRGAIAIVLLGIMGAVVLFAFIALWTGRVTIDDLRTLLEILFAPLVGLVGAVTGFYYGSRAQHD